jgi:hypothetical protein
MMRIVTRFSPLALLGVLLGCPKKTAIWVLPNSTRSNLVFVLGKEAHEETPVQIITLTVRKCQDDGAHPRAALWTIADTVEKVAPGYPTRIRYGVVPSHFREILPATDLGPGCYLALTGGSGAVRFEILPNGGVHEID